VRQAGDSFATLMVIDRGDPHSLGRWSEAILAGSGLLALRVCLPAHSAGRICPGRQLWHAPCARAAAHQRSTHPGEFLGGRPQTQAAGAAVYRRTLDGLRLLESTHKPLRAVMIISDGRDPNLYPVGGRRYAID